METKNFKRKVFKNVERIVVDRTLVRTERFKKYTVSDRELLNAFKAWKTDIRNGNGAKGVGKMTVDEAAAHSVSTLLSYLQAQ